MGKRYDWQVTPQNTPRFQERRMLFLVAMGIFECNLILTGIFLSANMMRYFLIALGIALLAGVQCFDRRRDMWTWGYVWFWVVFSFGASAAFFLWYRAYWWLIGYGIELIAYVFLSIWRLKKKTAKSRRKQRLSH